MHKEDYPLQLETRVSICETKVRLNPVNLRLDETN